ncbi:MAG TPA: ankyrin repeat domain-containing protein [Patescibacteria group bacterium]|nr:ankyrin repeat domain-containing protein [Patescibacteria group bacterium]
MSDLENRFIDAAKAGDIGELARLMDQGVEIDARQNDVTALAWAANDAKIPAVRWLMEHGANPDALVEGGKWTPFMVAAAGESLELVQAMLALGANPLAGNGNGVSPEQIARERKREANAALIARAAANSPHEVAYSYPLQDRVMQEIFNFTRLERLTLVREPGGRVEAMQRDSFSRLDDISGLRRAFAEHRKRGGKLSEGDVFSGDLKKTKLNPPSR